MKKILVTGSAGFIGFHVANRLLEEGFEVVGLDNLNNYYDVKLKLGRLETAGIENADELKTKIEAGEKIKGVGPKSVEEIKKALNI